jgi:hypothetical protein
VTPLITSAGPTALNASKDFKELFAAVPSHGGARYAFIVAADVAAGLASLTDAQGAFVFPNFGPAGGELFQTEALVSNKLTQGQMWLVDASGLIGDIEAVSVTSSGQASLVMDTAPSDGAAQLVSMWQSNSVALKALAWVAIERFRPDAVAIVTDANYGPTLST